MKEYLSSAAPLAVIILGVLTISKYASNPTQRVKEDPDTMRRRMMAEQYEIGTSSPYIQYICLNKEEVTDRIAAFPEHFGMGAASGGGENFGQFSYGCNCPAGQNCRPEETPDASPFDGNTQLVKNSILRSSNVKFIGGKVQDGNHFSSAIDQSSITTHIFYSHRDEVSRLSDSILETVGRAASPAGARDPLLKKFTIKTVGTYHIIKERVLLDMIAAEVGEIGYSDSRLLTCDLYLTIHKSMPSLVVVDYRKVAELIGMLAEKDCPGKGHFVDLVKYSENVKVTREEAEYTLREWVEAKQNILEWALDLRNSEGCTGETRTMEKELEKCSSGYLQVIGSGHVPY